MPRGPWAQHPVYKEAGRLNLKQFLTGLEKYAGPLDPCLRLFLNDRRYRISFLTGFGTPQPLSAEEVQNLLPQDEIKVHDKKIHGYPLTKRIWTQQPLALSDEEERWADISGHAE